MNELEQLRLLVATGKATPEQKERLNTLLGQAVRKNQLDASTIPTSIFGYPTDQQAPRMPWDQPAQTQTDNFLGTPTGATPKLEPKDKLSPSNFKNKNEYIKYRESYGFDKASSENIWIDSKKGPMEYRNSYGIDEKSSWETLTDLPFITPGGSDISTELYTLGRAIGAKKGADGRVLTGVAAGGAALFDIGRNVLSGIGFEKRNQYVEDYYRKKQQDVNFTANPQYENANTTGGFDQRNGGTFYGQEGGEAGMQQQQQQQQQDPNQQQGIEQGQNPDQSQQIMEVVMGMLQQGATPEEVVKALMEQGMPPQQAQQIVQMVIQASSGAAPEEVMKAGGLFFSGGTQQGALKNLFKSRYGEKDYFDPANNPGYDPNNPPSDEHIYGSNRGIRESRELARKINRRIRNDEVGADGRQYGEFAKVHGRDFVVKDEIGSFSTGGRLTVPPPNQNPTGPGGMPRNPALPVNSTLNKEVGETITFMHKGKKVTGVIKENKNGQITLK